jgi:hypothetical protein
MMSSERGESHEFCDRIGLAHAPGASKLPGADEAVLEPEVMGLSDAIKDETKKGAIIKDCLVLVDEEVASKSGISGFAVKAGYSAVKGIKPGFIQEVVGKLLPEWALKLDPLWVDAEKDGQPIAYFDKNRSRVADELLSVTDAKIGSAKSGVVKKTYSSLRGSAKKNVEEAVPRLAKLMEKHAK